MKKYLKVFISMFISVSFILTGCTKENSMGGDPSGCSSAHLYDVVGRVTEIVGKNTVLINILEKERDFQIGDTVAVKYGFSQESEVGLDNLKDYEAKPLEVQIGDIVSAMYWKAEKRDIGEMKNCNYVSASYLGIIPEERYKSMYPEDADES